MTVTNGSKITDQRGHLSTEDKIMSKDNNLKREE